MSKVDALRAPAAPPTEESDGVGSTVAELAGSALEQVTGFGRDQLEQAKDLAATAWQWASNDASDEQGLVDLVGAGGRDLPKKLSQMDDAKLSWLLQHLTDEQRESVLRSLDASGLAPRTVSGKSGKGAVPTLALYEVNDRQPPALRDFLHQENVYAARAYQTAYARYADDCARPLGGRPPAAPQPPAALKEPGTGAALDGPMSLKLARSAADYVTSSLDDADEALTISKQLKGLAVGDEVQLSANADGYVGAESLGLGGKVSVKRGDDGYRANVQFSVTESTRWSDRVKAVFGGTTGVEVHCQTEEEAIRAAKLLTPAGWASMNAADLDFLKSHLSGVDLKLNTLLKATPKTAAAVSAAGSGKAEGTLHLDLEKQTATESMNIQLVGDAMLGPSVRPAVGDKWSLQTKSGTAVEGNLTVKRKLQLPDGFSLDALREHPAVAVVALGQQLDRAEVTVTGRLEARSGGDGRAAEVELKTTADRLDGVLLSLVQKKPVAALHQLAELGDVEAKTDATRRTGIDVNLKGSLGAAGGGLSFTSQKVEHRQTKTDVSTALAYVLGR